MISHKTVEEWQKTIGENFRNLRLQRNLDQRDLAAQAGVALNAVKRLEAGETSTTRTLIKIVRILGRTDWLDSLAPQISINPLQMDKTEAPRKKVFRERKHRSTKNNV